MSSFLLRVAAVVGCLHLALGPIATLRAEEAPDATTVAAQSEKPQHLSATEVFNHMLPSTCWMRLEWVADGLNWHSYGTGWVYDVKRRLIVTNEHVVHNFDTLTACFPEEADGEVQHDPAWYEKNAKKYKCTVIDRSTSRDLALVQLDDLPANAVALKLAEKSPPPGERLFALAALPEGSEGLWIMTTGEVRQVYRRSHANRHYARVVETQLPTNRGNSGGAVVNDQLEVVAVVEGHKTDARLVSLFIDVNEIREFLNEADPCVAPATAADFETRATRRFDESRYDQAIADYSAALKLDSKQAITTMNRGWAYLQKGDYETAKADFEAALKIDPELRGAYEGRGTCYRELQDYDTAIRDLTEAIRRDATDADTYARRAKCYSGKDDLEHALKDFNRAVELSPSDTDYLMGRAITLRGLKRFDEAMKDLQLATNIEPQRADGYYEIGFVCIDKEEYPQARFYFDLAVQRDATRPEHIYMRGMASFSAKDYAAAIPDLNQAIAMTKNRPHYYWNLGIAWWNLDRFPESAQAYSEYIRLKPDEPQGYTERAYVYDQMGRKDLADVDRAKAKQLSRKAK